MNSEQCLREPPEHAFAPGLSLHAKLPKGMVVLVEDEGFLRDLAGDILEWGGHRVLKACDAETATVLFRDYGGIVDLLLTDVLLPGKSGRQLAKQMRELIPALKIMFISGSAENFGLRSGIAEPSTSYLQKPFSAGSLLEKVDQLLAAR